jgi:hypothetical protein
VRQQLLGRLVEGGGDAVQSLLELARRTGALLRQ